METMRRVVMVLCAALLFVPVNMKSRMNQDIPARAAFHALSSGRVAVKVSGDVIHPGIYYVSVNSLATSAINMANPVRSLKKYKIGVTAASPMQNGSALRLVTLPDGSKLVTADRMTVPERLVLGIPLEISTMTVADFDRLPGIGPALARLIVEYRQNNGGILRVEDLKEIEGIGEKKYKMICSYFNFL